jgi:hypothetical protein
MTTKPKTRKAPAYAPNRRRARAISEAEFAAMDFEPLEGEINTKCLPNSEQFTEDGLFHLITCRMALVMMYRTKAELSEMFEDKVPEDETEGTVYVRMPANLKRRIEELAESAGLSANAWAIRCFEQCANASQRLARSE